MPVQIHGNTYVTVAERLKAAQDDLVSVSTEVLFQTPVVIKATVATKKGTFTGISAANPDKTIEKMSPYEVAETSAVGRALGFAGYGVIDSIASADEMKKAEADPTDSWGEETKSKYDPCKSCGGEVILNPKTNKLFCKNKCWLKNV